MKGNHHCFRCPICGECYFCLGELGMKCLCESAPVPNRELTKEK